MKMFRGIQIILKRRGKEEALILMWANKNKTVVLV